MIFLINKIKGQIIQIRVKNWIEMKLGTIKVSFMFTLTDGH